MMDAIPKPHGRYPALALALAAAAALYVWFGAMANRPASSLTHDYTQALAAGQSYLEAAPNPQLLAARDPFDPEVNRSLRILDASLFNRRYYLFFGVTPFLTLLVPWLLVFGRQLTDCWAITAYSIGAILCAGAVLRDACGRYFPRAGAFSQAIAAAGAAVCGGGLLLVRNPTIHELEVAAAWFFESAAILLCYRALHCANRPRLELATAGLCAALAVGARPSHVLFAAAVLLFIIGRVRAGDRGAGSLSRGAACAAPLLAVGAGLAWFNWHRFGNPLEFGYRYALVDVPAFASSYAGIRNVPYNLWHFLVGLPRLSGWFPYFETPAPGPIAVPVRYYVLEQVYGAAVTAPFIACALALVRGWGSRPAGLRAMVVLLLSAGGLNLAFLCLLNGAVYRYTADFLPYLSLAGALGVLCAANESRPGWPRATAVPAAFLLVFVSLASSFCCAFALYDLARFENPAAFSRVGRLFDEPRLLWEGWVRTPLTQYRVEATLPPGRFGAVNPLLVCGARSRQNFIYLYYTGPGRIQVGFEATGMGGPVSAPVLVDYARPAVFELALGLEWPPAGAWPYHGLSAGAVRNVRRRILVRVNGNTALDSWVYYHPTKGLFHWGLSPDDAAFGRAFEGAGLTHRVVAVPDAERLVSEDPGDFGPVRVQLTRGASSLAGARQPLVCIGYRSRCQSLTLAAVDDERVRLAVTTWGSSDGAPSVDVTLPVGTTHTLELAAGGLLPPMGSPLWGAAPEREQETLRGVVRLSLDGRVVLEGRAAGAPEVGPTSVALGENTLGESGVSPRFGGRIRLVGRGPIVGGQAP